MSPAIREQPVIKQPASVSHFIQVEWPVRRFTIAEYEAMWEYGLFAEEEHFELLNGLLVWNTDRMDMDEVQPATLLPTELPLRRFSVDEYQRLIAAGILGADERLELIDGLILTMSPINPKHADCVDRLTFALIRRLDEQVRVRIQSPITLEVRFAQPQPDVTLALARPQGYADRHPGAGEVLLVIEVSDSTLEDDRDEKLQLYAVAGLPEYWILNLVDMLLEVYQEPYLAVNGEATYQRKQTFTSDQTVAPLLLPNCQIDLSQVFPTEVKRGKP
jgi:Uma2 family endonuclease